MNFDVRNRVPPRVGSSFGLACHVGFVLVAAATGLAQEQDPFAEAFVNFETAPVHPIDLSPEGNRLGVCNLADAKLELYDVSSGRPVHLGSIPVGLDPVTVRFRTGQEAWVINHLSDSISVVDVDSMAVLGTIQTLDTPTDVVFGGTPARAFVACSMPNTVQVFDPETQASITNLAIQGDRPRALSVSPDGDRVYAAIFESGNGTTVVGPRFRSLFFFDNVVSDPAGPYAGENPPPNAGAVFEPPINPATADATPPLTSLIVRKNDQGRWLDDNQGDWTEFVSGTNAHRTQRVAGWDLPDRDLAVIHTSDYTIEYARGLMNLCMAVGVNPASGLVTVVGTDAINEVRFEPNLNGVFTRVRLALVNPDTLEAATTDLNPHLDYSSSTISQPVREMSIGDPRAVVWSGDGSRGYVAGMGSRNVVPIRPDGQRLDAPPIDVGEGPCGLAWDQPRQRLYVLNRFSSSISVIDSEAGEVIDAVAMFDPTPLDIAAGRKHLYDTRKTSGLGQASCASCHPEARMDRLAWDLGNPGGGLEPLLVNNQGMLRTNTYHPMKGVMVTQTLQDIIGHEPFHWRGDRPDIESFNGTFTNLQGAARALAPHEMDEFGDFLASIRLPPNPYRNLDNSLSTQVPLPGHFALGDDELPAGASLPDGDAVAGLALFRQQGSFCTLCHTLPTGLGREEALIGADVGTIPTGPNGEHHFPLAPRMEGPLGSKISQFRNLADKVGMDGTRPESQAGFGFGHNGTVDSLTRFLKGVRVVRDREIADLIAFLLSVSGSDTALPGDPLDSTPPAGVGQQLTVSSPDGSPLLNAMLALARAQGSRVQLIAKQRRGGLGRGWLFEPGHDWFQSDRVHERHSLQELLSFEAAGPMTFTLVPTGSGARLGIDRDLDGVLDQDELAAGTNAADRQLLPRVQPVSEQIPLGTELFLHARVPPLPAFGTLTWWKDGQVIPGATNDTYSIPSSVAQDGGVYRVSVRTAFQSYTSSPITIEMVAAVARVNPASQSVRAGSNALFTASVSGIGPFEYRWLFNDEIISGANGDSLVLTNVQVPDEGVYRVTVSNTHGMASSAPAALGVLVDPTVIVPALSQSVLAGEDATFSFVIDGHPPPFGFLIRRAATVLTNYLSNERVGFLTLVNVQHADAGTYRIVVTNAANPTPGLNLSPVTLTVLADTDQDGLPDAWEVAHGLAPENAGDASADADLDGLNNLEEYRAGTDPRDPTSRMRLDNLVLAGDGTEARIEFFAASNRTYSVLGRETLGASNWGAVASLPALPVSGWVSVTNRLDGGASRFYRLVTPRVP